MLRLAGLEIRGSLRHYLPHGKALLLLFVNERRQIHGVTAIQLQLPGAGHEYTGSGPRI